MRIIIYSLVSTDDILLDLYNYLKKNGLEPTYKVSTFIKSDSINYRTYSQFFWFIVRAFIKTLKMINIPYYWIRHIQELIFDSIFSHKHKQPAIIITTNGWIPKITNKNKKMGGLTILVAGNPCDLEMARILKIERKKFYKLNDIYNFNPRLKNYKKTIENSDKIIIFNDLMSNSFLNYVDKSKLIIINFFFPIKKELFKNTSIKKNETYTFCYIAHTILLKGLHVLLDAWEKANIQNAQLIIGGSIQQELKPFLIKKTNSLVNVHYLGKIIDLNQFYRSSHVFVCPSLIDGGPRTITEAQYCGLPVVASKNCGYENLIENGENGFVYKNNDPIELAKHLNWFLTTKEQTETMSEYSTVKAQSILKSNNNFNSKIFEIIQSYL